MEPVTLQEIKAFLRIDADYVAEDSFLELTAGAARQIMQDELNIGLVPMELEFQWNGCKQELPLSPTIAIVSVKDSEGEDVEYSTDGYQAKSIWVNWNGNTDGQWFYSISGGYAEYTPFGRVGDEPLYKCIYQTGYEVLPQTLKLALLAQIDHMYKLRGQPEGPMVSQTALNMASRYSRNLVI